MIFESLAFNKRVRCLDSDLVDGFLYVNLIRLNLFVKINLLDWLNKPFIDEKSPPLDTFQMQLF